MGFLNNIGGAEWLIIGFALMLIFGNKKMNEVAKGLGQSSREFKKAKEEWDKTVTDSTLRVDQELKQAIKESLEDEPVEKATTAQAPGTETKT